MADDNSEFVAVDPLEDFERTTFTHAGQARPVYRKGTGPAVIVIAEIPGITPKVADFARRVVDLGCTAVLPELFGVSGQSGTKPNDKPDVAYMLQVVPKLCVSKEFRAFARGATEPISLWLRAL